MSGAATRLTGLVRAMPIFAMRSACSRSVKATRPDWIVLAAAYTDVDGCESNPDRAFAVNRDGAVNVATAAKAVRSAASVSEFRLCFRWKESSAV